MARLQLQCLVGITQTQARITVLKIIYNDIPFLLRAVSTQTMLIFFPVSNLTHRKSSTEI